MRYPPIAVSELHQVCYKSAMLWDGNPLERFFGRSQNGPIADLLAQQPEIASRCSKLLRESSCKSLDEIIALEHEGDATEEKIHEIIDSSFILRFDKSDIGSLANSLDNILNGMRQVAMHVDIYTPHIPRLRPEAEELLQIIEQMTAQVQKCTGLLHEKRLPHKRVRELTRELIKAESRADAILHKGEAALVREYGIESGGALTFLAHDKLLRMLEHITDVANHCGTLILSITRKEA